MTGPCATCGQPFSGPTYQAVSDLLWAHDETEHRGMVTITQLPNVDWHSQAMAGIRDLARTGKPFVISEVIRLGVPDAPNPRTDWPRVQKEAADLGWIVQTGRLGRSVRPTAKSSPVAEWIGTAKVRRAVA